MNPVDASPTTALPKTNFRVWMERLVSPRGDLPEWPWLLRELLAEEFHRQRIVDRRYAREVFKDRDGHDPTSARVQEKRKAYGLYHLCRFRAGGCLTVGDTRFWLLGYEWPNQGRERGRRADLIGLTVGGGLTVFECKLDGNPYAPFAAVLEGLDYLACLTAESNFQKIREGFSRWRLKPAQLIPPDFGATEPRPSGDHGVVVLAPAGYYSLYRRSNRGTGWGDFAAAYSPQDLSPTMRFAQCDFDGPVGAWVSG